MNEGPPNPQLSPEFEEYYEKLNKQFLKEIRQKKINKVLC